MANSYQRRTIPATDVRPAYEEMDYGSDIVSFDLSDFATASEKSRDWVRGYGNVIMATDKYLFLAQQNYENETVKSLVHSYDISSPIGTFTKLAAFDAGGEVKDKFKMHVDRGDVRCRGAKTRAFIHRSMDVVCKCSHIFIRQSIRANTPRGPQDHRE